jgi:hypothetical protein
MEVQTVRTNEAEKMKELIAELEGSPVVEKLRAEKAKQVLTTRRAAAARMKAADDELKKSLPALQTTLDAAQAQLTKHDEARKVLLENVRQAQAAVYSVKLKHESERRQAESVLLETYEPAIDEAREYFQTLHEQIRHKKPNVQIRDGERYVNEKKEQFFFTNAPAINAAIEYCRDAMREIGSMKLEPAFDAGRIEALKRGLPNTDELTENKSIVRAPFHWNRDPLNEGRSLLEAVKM